MERLEVCAFEPVGCGEKEDDARQQIDAGRMQISNAVTGQERIGAVCQYSAEVEGSSG